MARWIDVSVTLHDGMVSWPGDPPVKIGRVAELSRGDMCNLSKLDMGAHTGTHMDAPLHFLADGVGLDAMPLDAAVGKARVVAVRDPVSIKVADVRRAGVRKGERILFQTANSRRAWAQDRFVRDFVYLETETAEYLAARGVKLVGVDYLSVGGFEKNVKEVHDALLGAGVWIIEGLDLSRVRPGPHELVCLPIKIAHSDGAPCRAIVRRLPG
jgi:arylformamidase